MRVLVITQYFWPEGFRINDVVESLTQSGVEVDVLTGQPNYPEGKTYEGYQWWRSTREEKFGATVFRVPLFPRGSRSAWRLALNYLSFVVMGSILGPWLLRGRAYRAIFVYAPSPILQAIPALLLGRLKRARVFLWVQDLWPESLSATGYVTNTRVLGLVSHVVKWIYRHTDLLLLQSEAFEAPVRKLAGQTPIRFFPNSVESLFLTGEESRPSPPDIPALNEGFAVLFAGNVGTAQAVEVILGAAALLKDHPEIRFIVVGQGSRWAWLQSQIALLDLKNIHLPGRFPVETMPGLMQKAGALLVTLADDQIFGLTVPSKVQAYLAVGRPVLACLNGEGARIVAEAEAGIAVPAGDCIALAEAVLALYRTPADQRRSLGENGRRYFSAHFDHGQLMRQLMDWFEDSDLDKASVKK